MPTNSAEPHKTIVLTLGPGFFFLLSEMDDRVTPPGTGELRDGLVIPTYLQFCLDNALDLKGCDNRLKAEAMALFNEHKPHYGVFNGHVVHFQLWSWEWDFVHTSQPIRSFLEQAACDRKRLEKFEVWFRAIVTLLIALICLVGAMFCERWLPEGLALLILAIVGGTTWQWLFGDSLRERDAKKRSDFQKRLTEFRLKVEQARSNPERPLCQGG